MQSPKVVIVGAGSLFFGRKAIWQMVHSPHLRHGTLALVDTDADRLAKMVRLAQMVIDHNKSPLKLEASTDRREVLPGADFVVLSFAVRNAHYRGIDCRVSEKYGIRMCSGDTIGPGGVFRSMREMPAIFAAAADIRELCPDAWLINYINPTSVHGIALQRFFPDLKSFALCDAQYTLKRAYARYAGLLGEDEELSCGLDRDFSLLTAGPNHFTWMLKAEHQGRDITDKIVARVRQDAADERDRFENDRAYVGAKGIYNAAIQAQLHDVFGYLPTVLGHTKEYLPYWQGRGVTPETITPLKLWEEEDRVKWTNDVWKRVDDYVSGKAPIAEFDTEFGVDPATDIIESMWGNLGKRFFINTANRGAVTNMANDSFLELYCDVDMTGPRPHPVGEMPLGLRGLMEQVLDTHVLTAEAIRQKDILLIRRAMLVDPLTQSIADTEALLLELLEAERDALPDYWYPPRFN